MAKASGSNRNKKRPYETPTMTEYGVSLGRPFHQNPQTGKFEKIPEGIKQATKMGIRSRKRN